MILVLQIAAGIFLGFFAVFAAVMLNIALCERRRTGRWPKSPWC